jgi:hypothetical protein
MTATTYRPIRCPHGTDLVAGTSIAGTYGDGCRSTSGAPVRFWCGPDEMLKPHGVSITEGEYRRAHAEALILNAGDELYDEAARMNMGCHPGYDVTWGQEPIREPATCSFRGLISKRPCTLSADHDGVHNVWGDMPTDDAATYLGEVPWTDRIEDF